MNQFNLIWLQRKCNQLKDWYYRQTWWRKRYKKHYLSETDAWQGRCKFCEGSEECNVFNNKSCPCRWWNQILVRK